MTRNHKENGNVRMELKYCEHCGGLWVREGGGGAYCEKCEEKVADLPIPKKRPGKVMLPLAKRAVLDDYETESPDETPEFEAAGGVA